MRAPFCSGSAFASLVPWRATLKEDEEREYLRWRRFCQRQSKNRRRREMRRIEYCANPIAEAVIDGLRTRYVGGDASSILNRIVAEWAARAG
jgi:hypothetical protein